MAKTFEKLHLCTGWLKGYLADGSRPQADILKEAGDQEYSRGTLVRAKAAVGVESIRRGQAWYWRDPDVDEPASSREDLAEAIFELTRAIKKLAKVQASHGVTPALADFASPLPTFPIDVSTESWTDQRYEQASLRDCIGYKIAQRKELERLESEVGRRIRGFKLGDPDYVVDNVTWIAEQKAEIARTEAWIAKKTPPDPRMDETMHF